MTDRPPYDPYNKRYSISATEDHVGCPRRRWFKKTCKLPVQQSTPTVFGDIGHACNERFLKADDRGMGKDGKPVDIFPAGWRTMKPRFAKEGDAKLSITEEEGALIKTLIQKSIDEGYLIREPGRRIEKEFSHVVHKEGKYKITLIGFIDLENPNEVLDHKFVKNMNYAMSTKVGAKRDIRKSIQMTTYGYTKYIEGHKGNLFLSLLYHIKDYNNPSIQKRSVEVTEFEVKQFFNDNTLPYMKQMLAIDIKYPKHRVLDYIMVPGPDDPGNDCNRHYGKPCPFIGVCTEHFSVQQYLATFGKDINELLNSDKQEGVSTMTTNSLINMCKQEVSQVASEPVAVTPQAPVAGTVVNPATVAAQNTAAPANTGAPVETDLQALLGNTAVPPVALPVAETLIPETMAPVPAPATQQPVSPVVQTQQEAPWYHRYDGQECMACKDNPVKGYNSNMQPCTPCNARNELAGIYQSIHYDVTSNTDGTLAFTLKPEFAGTAPVQETVVQAVAEPEVKSNTVMVSTGNASFDNLAKRTMSYDNSTKKATLETMPAAQDDNLENLLGGTGVTIGSPAEAVVPEQPSKGGYTMMIGCAPVKGNIVTFQADDILAEALNTISASAGKPIAEVEHFTMLQGIDACVPGIVVILKNGKHTVTCFPSTKGSAMDRLVEGLRIHADTVIAPIGI